jgi:pyruvate,water dikinase
LTATRPASRICSTSIGAARKLGKPIGICGQAPSDYPELAAWLVTLGIDSISLNPDVAIRTALAIADAERAQAVMT